MASVNSCVICCGTLKNHQLWQKLAKNEDNFSFLFSAANDRIEVVNPEADLAHEQILKSHIRYISDIDWNPKEPEVSNIFKNNFRNANKQLTLCLLFAGISFWIP